MKMIAMITIIGYSRRRNPRTSDRDSVKDPLIQANGH
jgi:hypothetical protein